MNQLTQKKCMSSNDTTHKTKKLNNSLNNIRKHSNNSSLKLNKNFSYDAEAPPPIVKNYVLVESDTENPDKIELENNILRDRMQEITQNNLEDKEDSMLVLQRFNPESHELELSNSEEYDFIKIFIEEGQSIDVSTIEEIHQSNIGKIIMEGYRRFLAPELYDSYDFKAVVEKIRSEKDTWFQLGELQICFQELTNQYLDNLDDRYHYLGTVIIKIPKINEYVRVPLYSDINREICFPSMRKIGQFYFSMINMKGNKEYYLDYDSASNLISIVIDEQLELVKYKTTEKGISFYEGFQEYLTYDYMTDIKEHENKHLSN